MLVDGVLFHCLEVARPGTRVVPMEPRRIDNFCDVSELPCFRAVFLVQKVKCKGREALLKKDQ